MQLGVSKSETLCMARSRLTFEKNPNTAFRSEDTVQYSTVRAEQKGGINGATKAYKRRFEDQLSHNNTQRMWQGIQHLTNYRGRMDGTVNADACLAEKLNHFIAQFEAQGFWFISLASSHKEGERIGSLAASD
ncbi:hypothetical protein JOB18_017302 [Solea senegalensis]|uniref:Uncharacterized protein n=1 Tax=Solea senegalensis TaxID=28829 RepID=A0AAV6QNJ2_SOLSE|nr:hypothetical protein JOB18_017302 [Solea senegalensis]